MARPTRESTGRTTAKVRRGDDVQLRSEQGSIDRDDAEIAITDNWPKLKNCYREAGDAMAFAEGGVMLRFDVDVDGRTTGVDVIESQLGNFAVETCLGGVARSIRFPRPHGGGRARVEYTLEFRSTDERPVIELPTDASEELRVQLQAQVLAICGPLGANDAAATVYVDRRGHVASAGLGARSPLSPDRAACAAGALARASVPAAAASDSESLVRVSFGLSDSALLAARNAVATASKAAARNRASKDRLASKARARRRH